MPGLRSLLLVASLSATVSALTLSALRCPRPFHFGRLEFAYGQSWCPSPPRLVLFPDGKVDMTFIDQSGQTVLIPPVRSELTDDELSRVRTLVESVNWNRIQPEYDAGVEDGDDSICRITMGDDTIETSVYAVGEAHEPADLTALLHYLKDLHVLLSRAPATGEAASEVDDHLEYWEMPPPAETDDPLTSAVLDFDYFNCPTPVDIDTYHGLAPGRPRMRRRRLGFEFNARRNQLGGVGRIAD